MKVGVRRGRKKNRGVEALQGGQLEVRQRTWRGGRAPSATRWSFCKNALASASRQVGHAPADRGHVLQPLRERASRLLREVVPGAGQLLVEQIDLVHEAGSDLLGQRRVQVLALPFLRELGAPGAMVFDKKEAARLAARLLIASEAWDKIAVTGCHLKPRKSDGKFIVTVTAPKWEGRRALREAGQGFGSGSWPAAATASPFSGSTAGRRRLARWST